MEQMVRCLTEVIGCPPPTRLEHPSLAIPILVFEFPSGGSLSVEFTPDAPDEGHLFRGAWLELMADDAGVLERRIVDAGMTRLDYLGSDAFYFAMPGGQVVRISSRESG
jgi:hypothetical protein